MEQQGDSSLGTTADHKLKGRVKKKVARRKNKASTRKYKKEEEKYREGGGRPMNTAPSAD